MRDNIRDINSARNDLPPRGGLTPRRLAAIVAGDIAGYSRLMEIDEEGTHGRVKSIQRDLVEPSIAEHHGRLVKTTGDGFLAIFDSPLEAVRCGIVIQQNVSGRNDSFKRDRRIEYRIGINLGDVIIEQDDIYGDGVNIASRLESIAKPGEVFISGGIYEQIKNKLVCGYEPLGERRVKNITDPVRVYRVLPDPTAFNEARKRRRSMLMLSLMLLMIALGSLWYFVLRRDQGSPQLATQAQTSAAPAETNAQAALSGPPAAKPSALVREPDMSPLPGGTFMMGSNEDASERPVHEVKIKPFAISRYPISVRDWNQCAAAKACSFAAHDADDAPVSNISWTDASEFVSWLTAVTGKPYRLPSEAEWEYAARGGTQTRYWWGEELQRDSANCKNCTGGTVAGQPVKAGTFKPNPFGLYDMGGNVDQWVEDCWHKSYQGAPSDGSPWYEGDCTSRVIRSGSWQNDARYVRPASRDKYDTNVRYPTHGFRVALSN